MPYIKKEDREKFKKVLKEFEKIAHLGGVPLSAGNLNYLFTSLINEALKGNDPSYSRYNEIIGMLECCKLELYRRKIAEYEETKIKQNGDVY